MPSIGKVLHINQSSHVSIETKYFLVLHNPKGHVVLPDPQAALWSQLSVKYVPTGSGGRGTGDELL